MPGKQDSGPLAELFLRTVPQVMRIVAASVRQNAPPGMDPAYFRLLHLLRRDGACRLSDLADMQSVSTPTMSNTISTLEERGWVMRVRDDDDRRVVQVSLTPAGEEILDQLHLHMISEVAARLSDLSQEERDQLAAGLDVMQDVFDQPSSDDS